MRIAVYLPLLLPLAVTLGARPLGERLPPRLATWSLTVSAVLLAAAGCLALTLLSATAVAQIPAVAWPAHLSVRVIAEADPIAPPVAVVAGVLLVVAVVAGARMLWRRARTMLLSAREAARLPGDGRLVVVEDPAPEAFALPGLPGGVPGRIVVSTGMLDALSAEQRRVLLEHERSHLRCHHSLFTAAVQFAATLNPLLRPAATAVAFTIERWADEDAARACGDRRLTAGAVGAAALAATTGRPAD
ncbi:M56 family metallopeptidase, partial [Actinomadura roseirufa]|uniref:M56 family metallopeptidase n=1 Tax=Actinomadura roseirufa TaxID=2094049 RepID=UPI001041BAF7